MKKLIWTTVKKKVNDLVPYENNPRSITDKQIEDLKRSLKKFDLVEIPAIDIDNKIISGHQRLKVLQLLGRGNEEIDVRIPNRKLSDKEFRDYLLTANRSGGTWNWEMLASDFEIEELLLAGFDSDDLGKIFDDSLEVQDDDFDEEKAIEEAQDTKIKPGDYFALGRHRLLCANSLEIANVQKLMGDVRADVIDTDMPYNIGLSYNKGIGGKKNYGGTTDDNKSDEEYKKFVKTILQNALSVAKPDCHSFAWCDEVWVWLFQQVYKELKIDSKRLCLWIKDNQSPTPMVAFNKVTEFCVYGTIGKPHLNNKIKNLNEVQNKEITTGNRLVEDILDLLNIWMVKRLPGNLYQHPTQKNPTVHEKALRRCSRPGDVVLDLTAGSGSILSACEQLRRTAYLCELEPVFCQVIINRFKQISNEKVTKLN